MSLLLLHIYFCILPLILFFITTIATDIITIICVFLVTSLFLCLLFSQGCIYVRSADTFSGSMKAAKTLDMKFPTAWYDQGLLHPVAAAVFRPQDQAGVHGLELAIDDRHRRSCIKYQKSSTPRGRRLLTVDLYRNTGKCTKQSPGPKVNCGKEIFFFAPW